MTYGPAGVGEWTLDVVSSTSTSTDLQVTVLGATGTTGSRVAERLRRSGHPVRAVSRRTDPRFDWTDPGTWPAVLEGATAVYLVPPEAPSTVDEFVDAAVDEGVERIVLLSARGPQQSGDTHLIDAEAAVTAAAPVWTVIRPSWFDQNFSEGFFRAALDTGELRLPVGDGREPFVDVDDIADVAVAALTDVRHHGRIYQLSGPEPLSFADAVAQLATATGNDWQFTPVGPDEFAAEQESYGTPAGLIATLISLFAAIRNGENQHTSDGVEAVLGRAPVSFAAFAARTARTW